MKPSTVLKKLEALVKIKKTGLLRFATQLENGTAGHKYDAPKRLAEQQRKEAARVNVYNITSLRYVKRSNYFVNYKDSCGVCMDDYNGHSYGWYALTKKIKGTVYLNTYTYSGQTAKHRGHVERVFRALGVKYVSLEAPRGLQDLQAALLYAVKSYGVAIVENKYARIKHKGSIAYCKKQLKVLEKLGHKASKNRLEMSVIGAEKERKDRLARAREESKRKREHAAKLVSHLPKEVSVPPTLTLVGDV